MHRKNLKHNRDNVIITIMKIVGLEHAHGLLQRATLTIATAIQDLFHDLNRSKKRVWMI